MKAVSLLTLGQKQGSPRLWIENLCALRAGFAPGSRFDVRPHGHGLVLEVALEGERTVSRKERGSTLRPVIDIVSRVELAVLDGHEVVRVVYGELRIYITPLASEIRRLRRLKRLQEHVAAATVDAGGLAGGGGVMTHAVHAGLADAGLSARCRIFNEIRADLVEHAIRCNDALGEATVVANLPLQELAFDEDVMRRLPEIDVLELGIPCSGASSAGRAKNKIAHPEAHPHVGHLIAGAIALIARLNPAAILLENVVNYSHSASASILRTQLVELGYVVHECVLNGSDWGELEARERWYLLAVTRGIEFDLTTLRPPRHPVRYLAEVLEDVPADDPRWSPMQYLREKEARDRDAGKGFRMQIYDGSEIAINTLTKGLAKRRSTDPMIAHPSDPALLRLPTVVEHARCKGVPEHLIEGLGLTLGHELLGQGIVYCPVRALARHLGNALSQFQRACIQPARPQFIAAA